MPRFPSAEWMQEFCERLEGEDDAEDVARALDGVYRFVVEPAGPLHERHAYDVAIRPADGGAQAALLDGQVGQPRLVMTASYQRWQQLIEGRLDVGMAIMLRRLRVSGDLARLIRDVNTVKPLMRALGDVETQWLDE